MLASKMKDKCLKCKNLKCNCIYCKNYSCLKCDKHIFDNVDSVCVVINVINGFIKLAQI